MAVWVLSTYVTLFVFGVFGNAVVIAVTLKKSKRFIAPVDLLVISLSSANLCSVLTRNTPVLLYHAFGKGTVGVVFCKVFGYFSILSGSMSAWLTVVLSVYRTIKLCTDQPSLLTRALESISAMKIGVVTLWISCGVLLSPTLMYLDKDKGQWSQVTSGNYSNINGSSSLGNIRRYYGCVLSVKQTLEDRVYVFSCLVLTEILPAAMMLIASTVTLWALSKYKKMLLSSGTLPSGALQINNWVGLPPSNKPIAHWRAAKLVLTLTLTYLACWATHFTVLAISFKNNYFLAPALISIGRIAYALYPVLCPYGLGLGSWQFCKVLRESMTCA